MEQNHLLQQIEEYLEASDISPSSFGRAAMNDPGFVFRLRSGGESLPKTVKKIRAWMAANPPASPDSMEGAEAPSDLS